MAAAGKKKEPNTIVQTVAEMLAFEPYLGGQEVMNPSIIPGEIPAEISLRPHLGSRTLTRNKASSGPTS